jgi:hypothetical protein
MKSRRSCIGGAWATRTRHALDELGPKTGVELSSVIEASVLECRSKADR